MSPAEIHKIKELERDISPLRLVGPQSQQPLKLDVLDLPTLIEILKRRASLILGTTALFVAAATAYVFLATPHYSATARILMDTRGQRVFAAEAVLPGLGADISLIESQAEIIRSRRVAERVLRKLGADRDTASLPSLDIFSWLMPWTAKKAAPANNTSTTLGKNEAFDSELEDFLKNLRVARNGLTYIIEVEYTHRDPKRAVFIADAFADAYLQDQVEAKYTATRQASLWLKARITDLRAQVRQAEERVQQFKSANRLVDLGELSLSQREMQNYMEQLVSARAKSSEVQARLSEIKRLATDPAALQTINSALVSPVIADLRRQTAEIKRNLALVISQFGDRNPAVDKVRAELADIDREVASEIDRLVRGAQNDFDVSRSQVQLLEKGLSDLQDAFARRNELNVDLSELTREAEATSTLYKSMLSRFKETEAQESLEVPDARVISYASMPQFADYPKKSVVLPLLGGLGLSIGLLLAAMKELTQRVFRNARDVDRVLGLPLIASLPIVPVNRANSALRSDGVQIDAGLRQHVLDFPASPFSQSIFKIRHWIEGMMTQGTGKLVVVSSALKGEGKSAVAINLAHDAALAGLRTLLVDCDLRNPSLTAGLAPESMHTIADVVAGRVESGMAIQMIDETGLDFCPGPMEGQVLRPMDFAGSKVLAQFFGSLRAAYDLVVVDTSPLLPFVDARPLLAFADVGVLVVRSGSTSHSEVEEAMGESSLPDSKALAVVLNMAEPNRYTKEVASGECAQANQDGPLQDLRATILGSVSGQRKAG